MEKPIIELINVTKLYDGKEALNKFTFKFRKNRIYGIVGPNGAGKTTILKAILSLLNYNGDILFKGNKPDDNKLKISYIPEIIEFYNYLTGNETVELITEIQGFDCRKMHQSFNEKAFFLEYWDRDKLIKQHSKGNMRKLFLLHSLSVSAELLLLDEPFSGLDPVSTEKLMKLFMEQKTGGVTIILNTHLYDVAKKICDEIIFLNNGEIKYCAERKEFSSIDILKMYEK